MSPSARRACTPHLVGMAAHISTVDKFGVAGELADVLMSELECSVCMCTAALAHSLYPCNHIFCFKCLVDWSAKHDVCPNCSQTFNGAVPCHVVDNLASKLTSVTGDPE